jgi:Glycosyl hydrolase family 1
MTRRATGDSPGPPRGTAPAGTDFPAGRRAVAACAKVRGCCLCSLLDTFEWAHGYSKRCGPVHVDYGTGRGTPRSGAHWHADAIRAGRLLDPPREKES